MPDDKKDIKPKPSKRPSMSDVISILIKSGVATGAPVYKSIASKIVNKGLSNISENLSPYGYNSEEGSSWERAFKSGVLNKKEKRRAEMEKDIQSGVNSPESKARIDLLNILANKKQKYNTISSSPYIPPDYKKGTQYVRSNEIDELVLNKLGINKNKISSRKELDEALRNVTIMKPSERKPTEEELKISPFYTPLEPAIGKYGNLVYDRVMGDATYNIGEDEKGVYVSYRDKWDLDPEKGGSKETFKNVPEYSMMGIYQKGGRLLSKAASNLAKEYSSPAEIYGRIYFDKKTGNRIK